MKRNFIAIFIIVLAIIGIVVYIIFSKNIKTKITKTNSNQTANGSVTASPNPLSIEYMRKQDYPGSDIVIEKTLPPGSNYSRFIASYKSEGLKIYALLTIPQGDPPAGGWPVIIFNHGYIPPEQYQTTERYLAYTDAFSRNGYIVFKSDYRGHGDSEGQPEGAYYSPAYTIDILNAVSSLKKYKDANPERIGMWGHSMGGTIVLRSMVVSKDIKAGVIWAGVVASYQDLAENWHRSQPWVASHREEIARHNRGRPALISQYGDYKQNPAFWNSLAPINFVSGISGPLQLHHGTNDEEVPMLFSERLRDAMTVAGKTVEYYTYEGDDHNLSNNLYTALQRSVDFFDKYLK